MNKPSDYALGRRFYLLRHADISGLSGRGVVAVGIFYPQTGVAFLHWAGSRFPSTTVFSGGYDLLADKILTGLEWVEQIHGHDGATEIVVVDPEVGG